MAQEGISNLVLASMYCTILRATTEDIDVYQQACLGRQEIENSSENIGLFFEQHKSLDKLDLPQVGLRGRELLADILRYTQTYDFQTAENKLISIYSTNPESFFIEDEISLERMDHDKIKGFKETLYQETLENQL